jgi:hypothetical protein
MTISNTDQSYSEVLIEGVNFGAAAKTLSSGLAGLAPAPFNVLGATLIAALWPTSSKGITDWEQIYTELQTIVKNDLEEATVQTAKDKLKGYLLYIQDDYLPAKKNGEASSKLFAKLESQLYNKTFFDDIVSVFMHETNTEKSAAALANFMMGASLQMALNQELAIVDPAHTNPNNSSYAAIIKTLCTNYKVYAMKAAKNVFDTRGGQISACAWHEKTHYGAPPDQWFSFTDSNDGYLSPNHNSQVGCDDAQAAYANGIDVALNLNLQSQVYDTVNSWDTLQVTPVPAK